MTLVRRLFDAMKQSMSAIPTLRTSVGAHLLALFAGVLTAMAQDGKAPRSPGLVATASDGQRRVVFITPTPNFNLTSQQSIHPQLKPGFTAEWDGFLNVPR